MRYISFILLLFILMSSCQDIQRTKKPKDLIPEDKMVDILTEMSLLQGARSFNRQELEKMGIKPTEYLWQRYDIDSLQFSRSSDYYAENYQDYQRIYERVRDSLEGLKTRFDSIRELEERERDSLRRIENDRDREEDTLVEPLRPETEMPLDSLLPDTTERRVIPKRISRE